MKKEYFPPYFNLIKLSFEDLLSEQLDLSTPEVFPTDDAGDDFGDDWDD